MPLDRNNNQYFQTTHLLQIHSQASHLGEINEEDIAHISEINEKKD